MNVVAFKAKSLTIGGVKEQRKQLCDFSLVVGFFRWLATTFAEAIGAGQNGSAPSSPARISRDATADDIDDALNPIAFPVWVIGAPEVHAHPLPLALRGAEVVCLGFSNGGRRPSSRVSTEVANDADLRIQAIVGLPAGTTTKLLKSSTLPPPSNKRFTANEAIAFERRSFAGHG